MNPIVDISKEQAGGGKQCSAEPDNLSEAMFDYQQGALSKRPFQQGKAYPCTAVLPCPKCTMQNIFPDEEGSKFC